MGSVCANADDDTWMVHPSAYDILEVSVVTMPDGSTWKGTEDHSKWVKRLENQIEFFIRSALLMQAVFALVISIECVPRYDQSNLVVDFA